MTIKSKQAPNKRKTRPHTKKYRIVKEDRKRSRRRVKGRCKSIQALAPRASSRVRAGQATRALLGAALLLLAVPSELLGLEVLVEEVEGLLVAGSGTGDGEHPLASIVMGGLGDGDSGSGGSADLLDLGASTANDASNHVGGDRDVLGLEVLSILTEGCGTGGAVVGLARSRVVPSVGGGGIRKVGTVSGAGVGAGSSTLLGTLNALGTLRSSESGSAVAGTGDGTTRGTDCGVVQDRSGSSLPVVDQALADLPDGHTDGVRVTLDLNDTLSRLGEHLLLGDHTGARDILDVLDLEALATNDGTHLVVRDEETDG